MKSAEVNTTVDGGSSGESRKGAEGARRLAAESLRQKDGADNLFVTSFIFCELPFLGAVYFFTRR